MAEEEKPSTPEERLNWLRERGVQIETPEDRRKKDSKSDDDDEVYTTVSFVCVPHDTSKPMCELTLALSATEYQAGDNLPRHLKHRFATDSLLEGDGATAVDLDLLRNQATEHLSSGAASISERTMRTLTAEGQVETFPLVRATPGNKYIGINVYLDEVGMLKRLPLNARAADLAARAGYNPPPIFYGDVYLGRIQAQPTFVNKDFKLGSDTATDATWLKNATMDNLERQTQMNQITGASSSKKQPSNAGEDGNEEQEDGYKWTQTEEEVEILISVNSVTITTKDIKVIFRPKSLQLQVRGEAVITIDLFATVDPDGCTWTLDQGELVITCEKTEPTSWPRIFF